jgi:hypothetical protein
MSTKGKRQRLYGALQAKVGLAVGEEGVGNGQIRALFRLPDSQMRQWLVVMHQILHREQQASWSVDISKKYFLLGGKTVQGWRIILRDKDLDKAVDHLTSIVNGSPNARFQVDQMPLVGRQAERNTLSATGKGARAITGDAGVPPIAGMFAR